MNTKVCLENLFKNKGLIVTETNYLLNIMHEVGTISKKSD
jgi:hypothetical protein